MTATVTSKRRPREAARAWTSEGSARALGRLMAAIEALHAEGNGARLVVFSNGSFHDPITSLVVERRASGRRIRDPQRYVAAVWNRVVARDARAFALSRKGSWA